MKKNILLITFLLSSICFVVSAQNSNVSKPGSVSIVKEIKPPVFQLVNQLSFEDADGNNAIDANERCAVVLTIKNTGLGDGFGLNASIVATGTKAGLTFNSFALPVIKVGETKIVKFPISANMNTVDGFVDFTVKIEEPNGFGTPAYPISVQTRKFISPLVKISDHTVTGGSNGMLQRVSPFDLQILLQNVEHGTAENVKVELQLPVGVFLVGGSAITSFATLTPGEKQSIVYNLIVNQEYASTQIPIRVLISEKYGKYAQNADINLTINQPIDPEKRVITPEAQNLAEIEIGSLRSDVDKDIPKSQIVNNSTFVMIIANQNYRDENEIKTALNDARSMKEYCNLTLGIPLVNIKLFENQGWKDMQNDIEMFAYTMEVNPNGKFIFFYFGHGMADPDPKAEDSYLLPVDGSSARLKEDGFSKNAMIKSFEKKNPAQLVVYLESCFSGTDNTDQMLAYAANSSGVRISEKMSSFHGNIVLLSASSDAQTANAYPEQGHNVFTYEFLKELKKTQGNVTLGELFKNVILNTRQTAANKLNGKKQIPTAKPSVTIGDDWQSWKLKP